MVQRPRIHEKKNETNHETISHRFEIQQIPVESQTRQDLGGALDHTEHDVTDILYNNYTIYCSGP